MNGKVQVIEGAYPVTVDEAIYITPKTTLSELMPLVDKKWNCLGDSITNGYGISQTYHYWIKEKYNMNVNNYGISNTTFTTVKNFFYPSSQDVNADYITVWAGINDFKAGAELGTMANRLDNNRNTFYGAIHVVCRDLITNYPNAKLSFFTPMKCEYEGITETNSTNSKGLELKAYVDAIKEVCEYYSIPVLDLYAKSNIFPHISTHNKLFLRDGIHPSVEGYKRLANTIERFLITL